MNARLLMMLSALSLSFAAAQMKTPVPAPVPTLAPTPAPAPTAPPLPGHVPASSTVSWTAFLTTGGSADLLGEGGSVIGAVNADGSVTLQGTLTLADVKAVRVTPGSGEATTYTLTRDLSRPGAIKFAFTGPNGKVQSLPLPALLRRQVDAEAKAKDAATDDSAAEPDGATADHAGKVPPSPGKGRGDGKK